MGGSSSQTIGQRYFAKLTTFIGNPIEKLIGINFDNRGWIFKPDNDESFLRVESPNLYGDKEGGVAGFIDIHTGTADQLPNANYSADFPKVSGYPFQSYLVFRGLGKGVSSGGVVGEIAGIIAKRHHYNKSFYHGNSGYMKEMLLWPKRIHVRNDGRVQWYDQKAELANISQSNPEENIATPLGAVNVFSSCNYNSNNPNNVSSTITANENVYVSDIWIQPAYAKPSAEYTFKSSNEQFFFHSETQITSGSGWVIIVYEAVFYNVGARPFDPRMFEAAFEGLVPELGDTVEEVLSGRSVRWIVTLRGRPRIVTANITGDLYQDSDGSWFFNHGARIVGIYQEDGAVPGNSTGDMNPIHKIREILTDDTAMNKPESDINDVNFKKAADVLYTEKLGISWSVTEKSCLEAINELCGHIEAGVRMNRQTGLYEMVLFRDDWFAENEVHTLPVNKIKGMQLDGATSADELINKLNVSYYNQSAIKNSSFSIAENAAIRNLNGHENSDDVKFPYFMHQRNAAIVSQWKLKQVSTPVWQGTFTTGFYQARKWNRYDLLKLEWPKRWNGTILVRIMKINLGTGTDVSIDFVEVVPYSSNPSSSIVIDTPVDTTPKPPQPALFKAFELSYLEAVQLNGQKAVDEALAYNPDAGYAAVIAQRPQSNSLNALMYTDIGNDYDRAGAITYSETAELDQNISQINTTFIVKNAGEIDMVSLGTQITINQEIMMYRSYDDETGLLTVKRGALDTIPQNHLAGSILYFADDFITVDPTEYVTGEIINVKALTTTPSGILGIDDVDMQQVEIKARAIRPYPPANVKINGEYWPIEIETDLIITWVDRNRVQQTGGEILGWYEGGVTGESGTTTHLTLTQFDENEVELEVVSVNVSAANTYTYPMSALEVDTRTIRVELKTMRDGYESYQSFNHTVELSQFFSAPYNLTVEFKND
ncbi:MAG: hypothetical protein RSB22_05585 [Acinetobacter sp.]